MQSLQIRQVACTCKYATLHAIAVTSAHTFEACCLHCSFVPQEWDPKDAAPPPPPEIDTLVLLDRCVDTISPLVTPLTYEGLINELIGITNGYVKLTADVAEGGESGAPGGSSSGASPQPLEQPLEQQQRKKLVAVPLNSNDALYARIRDLNVEQLGPFLQEKVRSCAMFHVLTL